MRSGECDVSLYVLCCSVNGSVCFVCCMFDSVCELFGETIRNMFGCVCYFVVECDELLSVVGNALLERPCMVFQRMCVWCLLSQWESGCSFHMFCLCFCMSEVISSFRSLRAGSQVFALLMFFSLCDFAYYLFG